jgi:hypothetical protein
MQHCSIGVMRISGHDGASNDPPTKFSQASPALQLAVALPTNIPPSAIGEAHVLRLRIPLHGGISNDTNNRSSVPCLSTGCKDR